MNKLINLYNSIFGKLNLLQSVTLLAARFYVAVISLEDMPAAAFNEHILWGGLLVLVAIWGTGKLS